MLKTAEAVSLGHPDKISDYISSYILDRMIEMDNSVKYAVEVMVKENTVILGGEITGNVDLSNVCEYVKSALREIGYDGRYSSVWGDYAINTSKVNVINLIGVQSPDINRGVESGAWGDQGVFVGYACHGPDNINLELYLARKLNRALYEMARSSDNLGLDIKTQITIDENGKISLSIKQANVQRKSVKPAELDWGKESRENSSINFEDKMARFLKDSEEKMQDVKKHQEFKSKNSKNKS